MKGRVLSIETTSKSTCSLYKIFAGINAITKKSKDFITLEIASNNSAIVISYFRTLIDVNIFHEEVLTYIKEKSFDSLQDIQSVLPFENSKITNQMEDIQDSILNGYILIQFDTDKLNCLLVNVSKKKEILQKLKLNTILWVRKSHLSKI